MCLASLLCTFLCFGISKNFQKQPTMKTNHTTVLQCFCKFQQRGATRDEFPCRPLPRFEQSKWPERSWSLSDWTTLDTIRFLLSMRVLECFRSWQSPNHFFLRLILWPIPRCSFCYCYFFPAKSVTLKCSLQSCGQNRFYCHVVVVVVGGGGGGVVVVVVVAKFMFSCQEVRLHCWLTQKTSSTRPLVSETRICGQGQLGGSLPRGSPEVKIGLCKQWGCTEYIKGYIYIYI